MVEHAAFAEPLTHRLAEALGRVATALRADAWDAAETRGLNPTQSAVLRHLASRATPQRVADLARHLGVRQPTVTDSVGALVRKELAEKVAVPGDARGTGVRITAAGSAAVAGAAAGAAAGATIAALERLAPVDQAALLALLLKTIRALQIAGAIPPQRMCVTCRHFRPHVHADADAPHHCALVDAAFGPRHLRVDCAEHDPAAEVDAAATWWRFDITPPQQESER